jgi:hypothetical protein
MPPIKKPSMTMMTASEIFLGITAPNPPQASRFTAGASGFLILSECGDKEAIKIATQIATEPPVTE